MKHAFTRSLCLVLFISVLSTIKLAAQLSEGGIPPGFKFAPAENIRPEVMPAVNVAELLKEDSISSLYKAPYRFGFNHIVNFNTVNSGQWTTMFNGDRIWQIAVKCPDAFSVNLAFSNFHLPAGAKLFVYSKDHKQVFGAFTDKQNFTDKFFGTELLTGNEAVVEYYEPAAVSGQGTFTLFRVTHGYKDVNNYLKSFGDAGACINNVNCPQYSAWATQKRSVICLVANGDEFCSASLVNNTLNDGTPYVLTANHCGTADGTWVFRFNWEAPGCTNPTSQPSVLQSIAGGTPIAHSAVSDFNLVRINQPVIPSQYNVFFNGWNHSTTPATSVTGIHHPSGDIKKISMAANAVTATTQNLGNGTAQVWQIGHWTDGVTEGGSSGSPLFDQNKRVIGQLYGGPSYCGATGTDLSDFYGRFCVSWDSGSTPQTRLRDWLDPANVGAIVNDGFDPNLPQVAIDAAINGITSPGGTSCNTTVSPVVVIFNHGFDTLTSAIIHSNVDGGINATYNWTGSLAATGTASVALPSFTSTAGNHTFNVNISSPNDSVDLYTGNDSLSQAFTTIIPVPLALPFTEGFTDTLFPPAGWAINNPNADNTWVRSGTVGGFGQSANSAYVDQFSPQSSTQDEVDDLITPFLNFASVAGPVYLKFDLAYARYNNNYFDSLLVLGSSDCGNTWVRLYAKGGAGLATAPNSTHYFTPTATQWRTDSIDVSSFIGQPEVQFSFEFKSGWANVGYIDNINISSNVPQVLDASLSNETVPASIVCSGTSFATSFAISNAGNVTLTSDTIFYQLDNDTVQKYVWTGSLADSASAIINLPALSPAVGSHSLTVFSKSPNHGADGNTTNDTLVKNFTVQICAGINEVGGDIIANIHPNPFADALTVKFDLSEATGIDAAIYTIDGRLVKKVFTAEKMNAGTHQLEITTSDISNGIYLLKLNNRYIKLERLK